MADKNEMTIRSRLESDLFQHEIAKVLPKHITPERMVRVAITSIMRTPKLQNCDQTSFFNSMLQLSQLGLEPDGRRAHLIPFENRTRGCVECQLIIDYKGLVELAMRSGKVTSIHADKICENDDFEYDAGELIHHRIDFSRPRGEAYAYYCRVKFKTGDPKCEVMTRDEVEAVRKRGRAASKGPWVTDFDEMAKKTVFRRLSKWLELSPDVRDAIETIEAQETQRTSQSRHVARMETSQADVLRLAGAAGEKPSAEQPSETAACLYYLNALEEEGVDLDVLSDDVASDGELLDEERLTLNSILESRKATAE